MRTALFQLRDALGNRLVVHPLAPCRFEHLLELCDQGGCSGVTVAPQRSEGSGMGRITSTNSLSTLLRWWCRAACLGSRGHGLGANGLRNTTAADDVCIGSPRSRRRGSSVLLRQINRLSITTTVALRHSIPGPGFAPANPITHIHRMLPTVMATEQASSLPQSHQYSCFPTVAPKPTMRRLFADLSRARVPAHESAPHAQRLGQNFL